VNASSPPSYSAEQITTWLRGLVTIAWADGHFSEDEQSLIRDLVASDFAPDLTEKAYEPIAPEDLAKHLGTDPVTAENFLRTAVMVALADGLYSTAEAQVLETFCQALKLESTVLEVLGHTLVTEGPQGMEAIADPEKGSLDLLNPVRHWLDDLDMQDPRIARFLCRLIPPQCPFERDVKLFGRKIVHIPPLCKLNPLYEQLVGLRFRALSYLADDCKEDVSKYC
jgi:tellurite resistance protein